jgi:hypothetical protein
VDASPTAYTIRSDGGKPFLAKTSAIENFSKYLKNKNITDIIIYYTRNNYNMYVKSVRIFRSAAKKVSHIFADTVESFFSGIDAESIYSFRKIITSKSIFWVDFYKPVTISIDVEYLEEIVKRQEAEIDKHVRVFLFSLILFTIDKLKEMTMGHNIIEFECHNACSLFVTNFNKCKYGQMLLWVEQYALGAIVRFINKGKAGLDKVEEKKADDILEKIFNDFREYIKTKSENKEYNFLDEERELLKKVILYAIGVFSLHYIIHFIDFNSFTKENLIYEGITMNLKYLENQKVLEIMTGHMKMHLKKYDQDFLQKLDSILKHEDIGLSVFWDEYEWHTKSVTEKECYYQESHLTENFLFLVLSVPKYSDIMSFRLRVPMSLEHVIKTIDLLTGRQYSIDMIYVIAFYILNDMKQQDTLSF